MNGFDDIRRSVTGIAGETLLLFERALSIDHLPVTGLKEWREIVNAMTGRLEDEILRVAVVGAIKSGKSTLVNALVGADYLRRGAGVITSIITRVRRDTELEATLILKGWDEINEEIRRALVLFPSFDGSSDSASFDIRNADHRKKLETALAHLGGKQVLVSETLDEKAALLSAYVKGFDRVKDILDSGSPIYRLEGEHRFGLHRDFAGDDSMAVYLKDLLLKVPSRGILNDSTEIADCQGVDSINPRHLAMIQEYLVKTNLIIYVISSRTGVRRADMGFLSLIRQMGFSDSILFVVNVDIQEHEGISDLQGILERVKKELSIVVENPDVYAFSSLYWLFESLEKGLGEKDKARLEQWRSDRELAAFSEEERRRFCKFLERGFGNDRYILLIENHLERLERSMESLREWIAFSEKILTGSVKEAHETLEAVRLMQKQLEGRKQAILDSLEGRSAKVKKELAKDVDSFLDPHYGELSADILDFIEHYSVDLRRTVKGMEELGFSKLLYNLFHEFRSDLEKHLAEQVNPRLVSFIRQEEKKAEEMFLSIAGSYVSMVRDAYAHHATILEKSGIETEEFAAVREEIFNIENFSRMSPISMPSFLSTLQFGADIRIESILKLGVYRGMKLLRRLLKRPARGDDSNRDVILALANALRRIKKETRQSLVSSINGYKENLKYQYFYPFVDAMVREIFEVTVARFRVISGDMNNLEKLAEGAQAEKDRTVEILRELAAQSTRIQERIYALGQSVKL